MGCTGVNVDKLSPYHIGFVIGPCMNASGRLDTAKRALELLEAKKVAEADLLAGDLKALNDSRKDMTAQAVEEAFIQVENSELKDADVLVVYLPECHESLAGSWQEGSGKNITVRSCADEGRGRLRAQEDRSRLAHV